MASSRPSGCATSRGMIVRGIALVVLLGLFTGQALGQTGTPTPQVVRESRFEIVDAPAVAEVVQQVVNFPPGTWTSPHSHGGQAIKLVVEGEITFRRGDTERKYAMGQAWSDPTGDVHAAGNETAEPASLLTNFLLPAGATQTTVQGDSSLQPRVAYEARSPVAVLPAGADVVQQTTDFSPGAWTGSIKHGGQAVHIVVSGEVTYRADGREKTYRAGESWQDAAGHPYTAGNRGSDTSRLFTTVLLPYGAQLAEPVDASDFPPVQAVEQEDAGIGSPAL